MIYDELIGEIYWVIGKIQSDSELEEELRRLNFDNDLIQCEVFVNYFTLLL